MLKQETVEFINDEGKTVKIVVKEPTSGILSKAHRIHVKTWTECINDGILTKKQLGKFLRTAGIWDDEKEKEQLRIAQELADCEKELLVKHGRSSKKKASAGKDIAIKMRQLRFQLRELVAEKVALEQNTAEALAENAKFDFLVSACTYHENGQKVYNTLEEYTDSADSQLAFAAAAALGSMLYSIDQDFEAKLPENKFLKTYGFVDDSLALVDTEGHKVDLEGRRINDLGQYIDADGNRIDKDGNLLDEEGNYVQSVNYVDDKGKKIDPNG